MQRKVFFPGIKFFIRNIKNMIDCFEKYYNLSIIFLLFSGYQTNNAFLALDMRGTSYSYDI